MLLFGDPQSSHLLKRDYPYLDVCEKEIKEWLGNLEKKRRKGVWGGQQFRNWITGKQWVKPCLVFGASSLEWAHGTENWTLGNKSFWGLLQGIIKNKYTIWIERYWNSRYTKTLKYYTGALMWQSGPWIDYHWEPENTLKLYTYIILKSHT